MANDLYEKVSRNGNRQSLNDKALSTQPHMVRDGHVFAHNNEDYMHDRYSPYSSPKLFVVPEIKTYGQSMVKHLKQHDDPECFERMFDTNETTEGLVTLGPYA